jgi:DNA-binding NarL/FixJ family response regulator
VTELEIIIEALTRLGRHRALKDDESNWLERAVRKQTRAEGRKRPYWTTAMDSRLSRMLRRGKKVPEIAEAMDKTQGAIWSRIRLLKGNIGHRRMQRKGFIAESAAQEYGLGA